MIIAADDKKTDPATEPLIGPSTSTAPVPELEAPPSFQESIAAGAAPDNAQQKPYSYYDGNLVDSDVFVPPGGEEPPPFTPYEAEFFVSGDSIISHDRHLNEDGKSQVIRGSSDCSSMPCFLGTRGGIVSLPIVAC